MPIQYEPKTAQCSGIWVRCKGRKFKKEFEVHIYTKSRQSADGVP